MYLTLRPQVKPIDSIWLIKEINEIYGLKLMGPYFSHKEATDIFENIINNSQHSLLGRYFVANEHKEYSISVLRSYENRLRDKLLLCKVDRANYDR